MIIKNAIILSSLMLTTVNTFAGQLVDSRDNKKYRTIQVGNTEWMAENLNYATPKSRCINDKPEGCEMFGRLYFHTDVEKGVCPVGWDLPTSEDLKNLTSEAINAFKIKSGDPNRKTQAGVMLKARKQPASYDEWKAGIEEWSASLQSMDILGFNAMLSGYYSSYMYDGTGGYDGVEGSSNRESRWWTKGRQFSTRNQAYVNSNGYFGLSEREKELFGDNDGANGEQYNESGAIISNNGLSVRCIKKQSPKVAVKQVSFISNSNGDKFKISTIESIKWAIPEAFQRMSISDARGFCPDKFHLPTTSEWKSLSRYIGYEEWTERSGNNWQFSTTLQRTEQNYQRLAEVGIDWNRNENWWVGKTDVRYDRQPCIQIRDSYGDLKACGEDSDRSSNIKAIPLCVSDK